MSTKRILLEREELAGLTAADIDSICSQAWDGIVRITAASWDGIPRLEALTTNNKSTGTST